MCEAPPLWSRLWVGGVLLTPVSWLGYASGACGMFYMNNASRNVCVGRMDVRVSPFWKRGGVRIYMKPLGECSPWTPLEGDILAPVLKVFWDLFYALIRSLSWGVDMRFKISGLRFWIIIWNVVFFEGFWSRMAQKIGDLWPVMCSRIVKYVPKIKCKRAPISYDMGALFEDDWCVGRRYDQDLSGLFFMYGETSPMAWSTSSLIVPWECLTSARMM